MINSLIQSLIIRRHLMNAGYLNIVIDNSDTRLIHGFVSKHFSVPSHINDKNYKMSTIISQYALELIEMHIKDKSILALPLPDRVSINPFGELIEPIKINLSL